MLNAIVKLKQSQLFQCGGIYGIDVTLQNRSCMFNELEHRGIYLRNDIRDRHIYIHTYIDRGGRHLTSVGFAQARPNYS